LPRLALRTLLSVACLAAFAPGPVRCQPALVSRLTLHDSTIVDQDDMCFWLHPTDLSLSAVVCSDKSADKLFVYDLAGHTLQVVAAQQPGNIDIRYRVPLGGQLVDIVAFNERRTSTIRVYAMDPVTRQLVRVDDGAIATGSNYGFTLYRSAASGRLYGFTGPSSNTTVSQYELVDDGGGRIKGIGPLRQVHPGGTVEGMVADDETGMLYLSEEPGGVWKYGAEPGAGTLGARIATVGENGLTADVEGITLYYRALGAGYLIVSSQGSSAFKIYDRQAPHAYLGTFTVQGVTMTDGVDVINLPLDAAFPRGAFACHNGTSSPYGVELLRWDDIADSLGLASDTGYWDPRGHVAHVPPPVEARLRISAAPNPMQASSVIGFALARPGHGRLAVHDGAGRRVRMLHDGALPAGPHAVAWDGRDDAGRRLPPGIYLAHLELEGLGAASGRIAVLR
jgi:3-phytase